MIIMDIFLGITTKQVHDLIQLSHIKKYNTQTNDQ